MMTETLTLPADVDQASYSNEPLGPSSQGCCKVSNGNVCGSGSLVGVRNGRSLILTNAHVAGTKLGKSMRCTFPHANNKTVTATVIMAAYSDRIMMDWAVLEADRKLDLPHVKLQNQVPEGEHYTGGYPRCRGPYYQRLNTTRITHNGTVWRWQPISIGGQSGSGVHSARDNLQYGLLTWSWGGDGAGQTMRSVWLQYANRAAVGFPRPLDLVELSDRAEDLEEGFFQQTNITTLPIWDHLDDGGDDDQPEDPEPNPELAEFMIRQLGEWQAEVSNAMERVRKFLPEGDGDDGGGNDTGPLFGL
ncbi:S1 family peptidase [Stieleria neptunia]|nr:serine protease [Stieleria neptunia]